MTVLQFTDASSPDESHVLVLPQQQQQHRTPVRVFINGRELSLEDQIRQQQEQQLQL